KASGAFLSSGKPTFRGFAGAGHSAVSLRSCSSVYRNTAIAAAARHFIFCHGDERFSAVMKGLRLEQHLLFRCPIRRNHTAEIDEVCCACAFYLFPIQLKIGELSVIAHHFDEALTVDCIL